MGRKAFAVVFFIAVSEIPTSESSDERIVGGKETTIKKYPYQLSFMSPYAGHECGASLIRPNIALTAAHCTAGTTPDMYKVRANSTDCRHGGVVVGILKYCQHPRFKSNDYDVTVLLLDRRLPLGPGIKTIPLQEAGVDVKDGTYGTVTGWGDTSDSGMMSYVLRKVKVPKLNYKICKKKMKRVAPVTPRMVCYAYKKGGKDSCQGDSGGPLVVAGKQVGIVSWGDKCAEANKAGVYTKISNKAIHKHIDKCIAKFSRTKLSKTDLC